MKDFLKKLETMAVSSGAGRVQFTYRTEKCDIWVEVIQKIDPLKQENEDDECITIKSAIK